MRSDTYFLRGAWGSREATKEKCAQLFWEYYQDLISIDPIFSEIKCVGKRPRQFFPNPTLKKIEQWLGDGVSKTDIGRQPLPDLGFRVSFVLQDDAAFIGVNLNCGCYSPWVSNICGIQFTAQGEASERLLQFPAIIKLTHAVIRHWAPDRCVVTSFQLSNLLEASSFDNEIGWITYFPGRLGPVPRLPKFAMIEPTSDGTLIIATKEKCLSDNPIHLDRIQKLYSVLGERLSMPTDKSVS